MASDFDYAWYIERSDDGTVIADGDETALTREGALQALRHHLQTVADDEVDPARAAELHAAAVGPLHSHFDGEVQTIAGLEFRFYGEYLDDEDAGPSV